MKAKFETYFADRREEAKREGHTVNKNAEARTFYEHHRAMEADGGSPTSLPPSKAESTFWKQAYKKLGQNSRRR
jgi:hypothetical protein